MKLRLTIFIGLFMLFSCSDAQRKKLAETIAGEDSKTEETSTSQEAEEVQETRTSQESEEDGTVRIENQVYKTVKIGNQVWMSENLNLPIDGSYCYDDDPSNCEKYGRLYTWEAAKKVAARVPGWHLPNDRDWRVLECTLGMDESKVNDKGYRQSGNVGAKLKTGGSSGFNALLAGDHFIAGYFSNLGYGGYFWSSSPNGSGSAWSRTVYRNNSGVNRNGTNRNDRFSVRLLKD